LAAEIIIKDGLKNQDNIDGWSSVSVTESLVPLVSEIYSDRATLA
jgi:hypothetical protein